ncbi:hypothetical protein SCALM49S_07737 [Streptomyces californicus]
MTVMNVRRLIPATAVAGAVALGLTALSACSTSDAADGGDGGKLKVTASFYPMQFLAERIGGEHVAVTSLTKPGVEPHDLELTPRQIGSISESDYVLYLKGIQPAVDDAIKQSGVKNTVDAATLTTLENHGSEVSGHDHGHEGEEHADEHGHEGEEAHEEHSEGDGHNHGEEGGADPHIWLDPVKYAEVAKGVGKSLEKADPDHAADYEKNTETLVAELDKLNTAYESRSEEHRHQDLHHHPLRLRLPRRALRAHPAGHRGHRPRGRAQPRAHPGDPHHRGEGEGHHGLLRDARQRQDRQDPREGHRPEDRRPGPAGGNHGQVPRR